MEIFAYELAQRFVGIEEVPGTTSNPAVLAMLRLDDDWPDDDSVAWCSAFMNYVAWLLRMPRSKSLRARSWLLVGKPIELTEARAASDVVILKRAGANQPGPDVIDAKGHVGWFAGVDGVDGVDGSKVLLLGDNQDDSVSVKRYPKSRILGVRRLV